MPEQVYNAMGSMPAFTYGHDDSGGGPLAGNNARSSLYKQAITTYIENSGRSFKLRIGDQTAMDTDAETYPVVVYQGAVFDHATNKMNEANTGHLGILDDPKLCKRLSGQNLYSEAPQMVKIV